METAREVVMGGVGQGRTKQFRERVWIRRKKRMYLRCSYNLNTIIVLYTNGLGKYIDNYLMISIPGIDVLHV